MPTKTYYAGKDIDAKVQDVMKRYHGRLRDADVLIVPLFVDPPSDSETGQPAGPALKHGGGKALAKIKIANQIERALSKGADLVLRIDSHEWEGLSDESRVALLDHELTHVTFAVDQDGLTKRDDETGKPKIVLRADDFVLTGFHEVIERHGEHAIEYQSLRKVCEESQLMFDFSSAVSEVTLSTKDKSVTMTGKQFSRGVAKLAKAVG